MAKPNMKQFMDATGADATTASEFLYGVVGSNNDVRNWSSIMSASDPLSAARQATFQMYANPASTEARRTAGDSPMIVPSSGAPSVVRYSDPETKANVFAIVAADGTPLRSFSSEERAREQARNFGITGDIGTGQFVAPRPAPPPPPPVFQPPPPPAQIQSAMAPQLPPFQFQQPMSVAPVPPPAFQPPSMLPPEQLMSPSMLPPPQFQQPAASPFTFEQYLAPLEGRSQAPMAQSVYGNSQPVDFTQQGIMGLPSAGLG